MDVPQPYSDQQINHLQETCLRIVYNDKKSTYENLLVRDRSVSVRVRNIQILDTEKSRETYLRQF